MAKKRLYYAEFRRGLDSGKMQPVYLFTGAEAFLKEQGLQALVDKSLAPDERSMNLEFLYAGTDVSGREVRERALTLPFFSGRRVLVVRQVERWRAADTSALADYAAHPSPTSLLILVSQDERLKLDHWKALAAAAEHVECYPLFDNQVPGWIEHRAGDYGKKITRDAVHQLIERAGNHLSDLDNELQKLADFLGPESTITADHIRRSAGLRRLDRLEDMNAAIGRRDGPEAVRLLQDVLAEGVPAPQVLGAVGWHWRSLLAARQKLDCGEDPDKILASVRHPQARRELQSQLRSFRTEEFSWMFRELLKLDEHIKNGKGHWEVKLQELILKVCRPARPEGVRAAAG